MDELVAAVRGRAEGPSDTEEDGVEEVKLRLDESRKRLRDEIPPLED